MANRIDSYLHELVARDASDLHLKAGAPPVMRIRGDLVRSEGPAIAPDELKSILYALLNEERRQRLDTIKEVDISYFVDRLARFRVNMFWQRGNLGAVFRVIPYRIRTIDELGMPPVCKHLSLLPRGLLLVTGPTGSGKSTSLAAMIDHINSSTRRHIMTVEDPIEYVHDDKTSIINQRELGTDTHAFADALKHVMRQNPDVILVGEMRDLETIQLAITAAETGHLVFATLHTTDAPQTIDRVIDVFEPEAQQQIRLQLATVLQAVISQTLLIRSDGQGRVAAFEVMICTSAIRTLIREGKTYQINTDIQTGQQFGMQTLDSSLLNLVSRGLVTFEDALSKTSNLNEFIMRAERLGIKPESYTE